MRAEDLPAEYVDRLNAVTDKRPRTVIQALLARGRLSTDDLQDLGYNHPPRAARDVRELGFPLTTLRVEGRGGRRIAAYELADPASVTGGVLAGRRAFPLSLKAAMVSAGGARCAVCSTAYEERYLQVDHRVPFAVGGDDGSLAPTDFQLLCGSDNRAKSWSCEHCPNWTVREVETCRTCYWSDSSDYRHVATQEERREVVVWSGEDEVDEHDAAAAALPAGTSVVDLIKDTVRRSVATPSSSRSEPSPPIVQGR